MEERREILEMLVEIFKNRKSPSAHRYKKLNKSQARFQKIKTVNIIVKLLITKEKEKFSQVAINKKALFSKEQK